MVHVIVMHQCYILLSFYVYDSTVSKTRLGFAFFDIIYNVYFLLIYKNVCNEVFLKLPLTRAIFDYKYMEIDAISKLMSWG